MKQKPRFPFKAAPMTATAGPSTVAVDVSSPLVTYKRLNEGAAPDKTKRAWNNFIFKIFN